MNAAFSVSLPTLNNDNYTLWKNVVTSYTYEFRFGKYLEDDIEALDKHALRDTNRKILRKLAAS